MFERYYIIHILYTYRSVYGIYRRNCDVKYIHCAFDGGPEEDREEQTVQAGEGAVLGSGEADVLHCSCGQGTARDELDQQEEELG